MKEPPTTNQYGKDNKSNNYQINTKPNVVT